MITFGSPLPVFESDIGRHKDVFSLLVSYMLKYLLEHDMVWLHLNHINDPIGFPIPDEDTIIERLETNQGIKIQQKEGLIAGNSNIRKGAFIKSAHLWYWYKPDDFSQQLVKTYEANYKKDVQQGPVSK
jgi:hypothetical protein